MVDQRAFRYADLVAFYHALRHFHHAVVFGREGIDEGYLICVKENERVVVSQELGKRGNLAELVRGLVNLISDKEQVSGEQDLGAALPLALDLLHDLVLGDEALLQHVIIDELLHQMEDAAPPAADDLHDIPHSQPPAEGPLQR